MAAAVAAVAAVSQASLPDDRAGSRLSRRSKVPKVPEWDFSFQRGSTSGQIPGGNMGNTKVTQYT